MSGGSVFDEDASRKLEAAYLTPDVVAQRRQTLRTLALQPGERVLGIGSGPGLLVAEMAEVVGPSGHVTGLEISDSMLALGRRRCANRFIRDRVAFVKADAAALPFPDGTFDVAVSTQVYEYVADLKAAFAELHRVLRPGGRALIIRHRLGLDRLERRRRRADAAAPCRLDEAVRRPAPSPHALSAAPEAGLQVRHRAVLVLFNPEYDPDTFSVANGEIMADFAVAQHAMTRDEAQSWIQDLQLLGREGRYFFSLNRYLFLASKQS
jgi:arsenite methyltransferase